MKGGTTLDRPIIVLGAARSGTTMMGEILGRHPDVAYWIEPKYIWRYGAARAGHDRRTRADATETVARYIRGRFERFTRRMGKARFAEKTPSNCLRVAFIDAVLPDCLFLNMVRDGRDVTLSARDKWSRPPDRTAIWRRLTSFEIPLRELPHYGRDFLTQVVERQLFPARAPVWGPRFADIERLRAERTLLEVCAVQWVESTRTVMGDLAVIPPERQLTFRYEELVASRERTLGRVLEFLGLTPAEEVFAFTRAHVSPDSVGRWRKRRREISRVDALLGPLLEDLGYVTRCPETHGPRECRYPTS